MATIDRLGLNRGRWSSRTTAATLLSPCRIAKDKRRQVIGFGLAGELEHAAALLHPKFGAPMRAALGGGAAIIPSAKKMGGPGDAIDVPLHYKDAAFVRSHFDAIEVRVPAAPRDDEIVVIAAVSCGGRPFARVGGLRMEEADGQDGLR